MTTETTDTFEFHGDVYDPRHPTGPADIPAWMPVSEARTVLVAYGLRSLPVADDRGLIGLITIEALAGRGEGAPAPETPIVSVMDWHLVQLPPEADEATTVHEFNRAAWSWLYRRSLDKTQPRHLEPVTFPAYPPTMDNES